MPIRDEAINVFMNIPEDGPEPRLELTFNHGRTEPYELGTGYGHIAITAPDLDGTLAALKEQGIEPERPAVQPPRRRLADLLRPRPRSVPDRDHRAERGGMIVERSMADGWLSNTYLVADEDAGEAVMIDAGGPVGAAARGARRAQPAR